jgi:Ca2+-binding EF-hand superfamily protein
LASPLPGAGTVRSSISIANQRDMEDNVLSTLTNLPVEEVQVFRDSFFFYDEDGSGHISGDHLSIIFNNSIYAPTTAQQRNAFSKTCNLDELKCHTLEFPLLVRFTAAYHDAYVEEVVLCLKQDMEQADFSEHTLVQALNRLGHHVEEGEAMALLERLSGDEAIPVVSKGAFRKLYDAERMNKAIAWRETCGFSRDQVSDIRQAYSRHADRTINFVMRLLDTPVFEALAVLNLAPPPDDVHVRSTMMVMLERLDRQGTGIITFEDFLLLVRHLENQKSSARVVRENAIVESTGFNAGAIQTLRNLFNDCEPNFSGKVDLGVLKKMLGTRGVIQTFNQRKGLKKVIDEVANNDYSGLEFSQFMDMFYRLESQGHSSWLASQPASKSLPSDLGDDSSHTRPRLSLADGQSA